VESGLRSGGLARKMHLERNFSYAEIAGVYAAFSNMQPDMLQKV
jgi:hypothetical protein